MKRSILAVILIMIPILSCSTYSTNTDIKDTSILKKIKNTGIIFRISKGSKLTKEELLTNCQYWLSVYQKKENITLIKDASDSLSFFNNPQDRFYQLSNENDYLKYKSIGILNIYLSNNQNELLNLISKYKLDSLIIYEVYSIISSEIQYMEFDSILALTDSNLNIAYLDHHTSSFESEDNVLKNLKNQLLDKITGRLTEKLQDMNLIGDMTEKQAGIKNINKSNAVKEKEPVKDTEKKSTEVIKKEEPATK